MSDPRIVSNQFSELSSNIAKYLKRQLPRMEYKIYDSPIKNSMGFMQYSEEQMLSVFSRLKNKNSSG